MPLIETSRGAIWFADHRSVSSSDETLRYPLLLIHGAAGTHLDWPIGLRKLNSVVPDLPGHGKSQGQGHQHVGEYAADMIALLNALDIPQAVIVGHSMGGAITLTLALDYPDRVAGLVLIGTGAHLPVNSLILDRVRDSQAEVGGLFKKWFWAKDVPDEIRQRGFELFMKTNPQVAYGDYVACSGFDVRDRLGEIRQRTLVIGGTADKMTPLSYAEFLAANIPNAQLVTVEGGGHMMAIEQPGVVVEAVRTWLK